MNAYALTKLAHVLTAVLSMGLVTACLILARASSGVPPIALRPLVRWAIRGLLLMIASGMVLDHLAAGALHGLRWFRIGIAWTVGAGVAVGYSRYVLARAIGGKLDAGRAHRRLWLASCVAFACVATTVVVMVRRP